MNDERNADTELPEVGFESDIFATVTISPVDNRESDKERPRARTVIFMYGRLISSQLCNGK